jgi:hypothetical protein
MDKVKSLLQALDKTEKVTGRTILDIVTINDLRDQEQSGTLGELERAALSNYEKYRIKKLNEALDEEDFQNKYKLLQAQANLSPYDEFLGDKYQS